MSLSATEPDAPATGRSPRILTALLWVLAGATCAGGLWAVAFATAWVLFDLGSLPALLREQWLMHSVLLAGAGAVAGFGAGAVVAHLWGRGTSALRAGLIGLLAGSLGGALTIPTMLAGLPWLHPLASSSLLWAAVGTLTGLCGFAIREEPESPPTRKPRFSFLTALLWGFACAVCAGNAWAAVSLVGWWLDTSFLPYKFPEGAAGFALLLAAVGAGYGLLVGAAVGFFRTRERRPVASLALGAGGALVGAIGGLSVVAAALAVPQVHPIVSSSLAWAAVGFLAGLGAYLSSSFTEERVEPLEDDSDEPVPEDKSVQWLLRERKRRWRDRSLLRVLPVLAASVWALIGAAIFAPSQLSLGLLAVGVLGLSVALVLYNQDTRLAAIESRFHRRRDS